MATQHLKVGDKVAVQTREHGNTWRTVAVSPITHLTAKQIHAWGYIFARGERTPPKRSHNPLAYATDYAFTCVGGYTGPSISRRVCLDADVIATAEAAEAKYKADSAAKQAAKDEFESRESTKLFESIIDAHPRKPGTTYWETDREKRVQFFVDRLGIDRMREIAKLLQH